jgi:hypothetical protein
MPAIASSPKSIFPQTAVRYESVFYVGMAIVAIVITALGFGPALIDLKSRTAPLTLAVGLHGAIYAAWLLLFLAQTLLIANRKTRMHRLLGMIGAGLAVLLVISGYFTSIAVAQRGFDLSGDLNAVKDPLFMIVFQLGDLVCFTILVAAGVYWRNRPAAHKRLMLLATVGALMPASLSHIIGHFSVLREMEAPIILIPFIALLGANALFDLITTRRIHPVSLWGALGVFAWANFRAVVLGPSDAWHQFATWLIG